MHALRESIMAYSFFVCLSYRICEKVYYFYGLFWLIYTIFILRVLGNKACHKEKSPKKV